jgi:pimeloyl-ACP methyl ester carboxylesterase
MQRHLEKWVLGLAAGLVLAIPQTGLGQKDKPEEPATPVKFDTDDGVTIQGTFYPGKKGGDAPCVLLLHELRGSSQQKGWDEVARKFQAKGFAVLKFDFRGHGKSTTVDPKKFWLLVPNQKLLTGRTLRKPPEKIAVKDMRPDYLPNLINDIAAAKAFLDDKNDQNECNSANLILVGAQEGATLGALWLKSEWYRHRVTGAGSIDDRPEAKDVACAVWLTFSRSVGSLKFSPSELLYQGKDKKVPAVAFVYGDQDEEGKRLANAVLKKLDPQSKQKKYYGAKAIRDAKKTTKGRELLSSELETTDWIVNAVKQVTDSLAEEKVLNDHKKKRSDLFSSIYVLRTGRRIAGKPRDSRPYLIPWNYFVTYP